jgi:hypothetical protein
VWAPHRRPGVLHVLVYQEFQFGACF